MPGSSLVKYFTFRECLSLTQISRKLARRRSFLECRASWGSKSQGTECEGQVVGVHVLLRQGDSPVSLSLCTREG